jgi:hypothetical protein
MVRLKINIMKELYWNTNNYTWSGNSKSVKTYIILENEIEYLLSTEYFLFKEKTPDNYVNNISKKVTYREMDDGPGITYIDEYEYDKNNKLTFEKNTQKVGLFGIIIDSKNSVFIDEGSCNGWNKYFNKYDEQKRLVEIDIIRESGFGDKIFGIEKQDYNDHNLCINKHRKLYDEQKNTHSEIEELMNYDEKKRLIKKVDIQSLSKKHFFEDRLIKTKTKYNYYFDDRGNEIKEKVIEEKSKKGEKKVFTETKEISYSPQKGKIIRKFFDGINKDYPIEKIQYRLSTEGLVTHEEYYFIDENNMETLDKIKIHEYHNLNQIHPSLFGDHKTKPLSTQP